jgi:hypothetical protein
VFSLSVLFQAHGISNPFTAGTVSSSNVLLLCAVHLGICHTPSSTCPSSSSNSCGCPDCSKHHIPAHLHSYCNAVKNGYTGGDLSSGGSDGGGSNGYDTSGGDDNTGYDNSGGGGNDNTSYDNSGGGGNDNTGYYANSGANSNSVYYANSGEGGDGNTAYAGDGATTFEAMDTSGQTVKKRFFNPWFLVVVGSMFVAMAAVAMERSRVSQLYYFVLVCVPLPLFCLLSII